MTDDKKIYIPSSPLRTARSSVLTTFEPGARTLEAGYQAAPPFEPLPSTSYGEGCRGHVARRGRR